ncbi:MAG: hypothetical protein II945_07505 [Bacteroidales bacterium]|nr:hypothetical protein [Bacteroidales bacterium]
MKSKKLFLSITINIVLIIALSISLYCTIKQRNVIRTAIEIIEEMTKKTKEDFANDFQYFEMQKSFIEEKIDSFYLKKNENIDNVKKYYETTIGYHSEDKLVFNTLKRMSPQALPYELFSKLLEYQFIAERTKEGYTSFFWLDGVGVNIISKQDTINLGEKYISEFVLSGDIFNKKQNPIIVMDGDTLMVYDNFFYGSYQFIENTEKRGIIKHQGYMTFFHPSMGITKLPIDFEYYVK